MRLLFLVFLLPCLLALALSANAQILDDSTRQVYDARTTHLFSESDILNGEEQEFNQLLLSAAGIETAAS